MACDRRVLNAVRRLPHTVPPCAPRPSAAGVGDLQARRYARERASVRSREYLRIIYGPEYMRPEHLERPRSRGLAGKRSLALREFALGVEGLERFVRGEPLRRIHECAFGVLAMESEPIDPRL